MQPLFPCTRPDFDGAFNFRIFLNLRALTCLGPGASCPPCPPPLSGPVSTQNLTKSQRSGDEISLSHRSVLPKFQSHSQFVLFCCQQVPAPVHEFVYFPVNIPYESQLSFYPFTTLHTPVALRSLLFITWVLGY